MAPVNNTVDKFGRKRNNIKVRTIRGAAGIGFKLTSSGDYDITQKRLTNVAHPRDKTDAITKQYIDKELVQLNKAFANILNNDVEEKMMNAIKKTVEEKTREYIQRIIVLEKRVNHIIKTEQQGGVTPLNNKFI